MEPAHGGDVAGHGADDQVLVTTGTSLLDNPADEQAATALVPGRLSLAAGNPSWPNAARRLTGI